MYDRYFIQNVLFIDIPDRQYLDETEMSRTNQKEVYKSAI